MPPFFRLRYGAAGRAPSRRQPLALIPDALIAEGADPARR